MLILNLTQHPATPEQVQAGVVDLKGQQLEYIKSILNFYEIPDQTEISRRAEALADFGSLYDPENAGSGIVVDHAMIGGAPFLMAALETALRNKGIKPLYAFSQRVSVEQAMPDGQVHKTNVFKHIGFVQP